MTDNKNLPEGASGFGLKDREDSIYDIYEKEDVGKYVVITHNGNVSAGKLTRIVDDVALLSPFQGMNYSGRHPIYVLFKGSRHQKVPLKDAKVIPITEESLKDFMAYENAEMEKGREKEGIKPKGKTSKKVAIR